MTTQPRSIIETRARPDAVCAAATSSAGFSAVKIAVGVACPTASATAWNADVQCAALYVTVMPWIARPRARRARHGRRNRVDERLRL
jgi:hypothetical protein